MSPKHLQPEQPENLGQFTQMWVVCLFDPFFCRKCQVNSRLKWTSLLVSSSNWYLTNSTNLQIVKRQCCQGKSPKSMKLRGWVGVFTSLGQLSQIFLFFFWGASSFHLDTEPGRGIEREKFLEKVSALGSQVQQKVKVCNKDFWGALAG